MKKLVLATLLYFTTTIVIGQNIIYDTIQYAKEHHQERLTIFKSESIVKGKIVFIGNSITEFGDWNKLLNDSTIINRGIAGDNTFGVLARLENIVQFQPKKIFIEIGINDISQDIPVKIIAKNIATIIKIIHSISPITKIYIYSILPTNDNVKNVYPEAYNKNNIVNSVNRHIEKITKKHNIIYVDINKIFRDENGNLNMKYAESDGLHLNSFAYNIWAKFLKNYKYL